MLDSWEAYLADPIKATLPSNSLTRVEAEQGLVLARLVSNKSARKSAERKFKTVINEIDIAIMNCKSNGIVCDVSGSNSAPYTPPTVSSASSVKTTVGAGESAMVALTEAFARSRFPIAEPAVFSGNPLEYVGWRSDLESMFSLAKLSNYEKLRTMLKYLGGPPKEAVKGLALIESESSFERAIEIL